MITFSAASFATFLRAVALAPALSLTAPGDLAAQPAGPVYERRDDCIAGALLSAEECEFAYRNARAEFEQKAPRYASRALCERGHGRCGAQIVSSGGWDSFGRGGASYVPRFAGIRITGAGPARRVLPVVAGGRVAFAARPVGELQDRVAGRQATIGPAASRGGRGQDPRQSAPSGKRGDRDDTVPVPMQRRSIGADVAPGLYVDPDGVEWYKPAQRR